jgi:hypothetical protein
MLPAAAVLAVLILAGMSLIDLIWSRRSGPGTPPTSGTPVLSRPEKAPLVPHSRDLETLSREEAIEALKERPRTAPVARLLREPGERDRLFALLKKKDTPEEIRLLILGHFAADDPEKALDAARAMAHEEELSQGPLRFQVYEILARHGGEPDLALLDERPFEHHQTRTLREGYRDSLKKRIGG